MRSEIKYRLKREKDAECFFLKKRFGFSEIYESRHVTSIYYDSHRLSNYGENIEGYSKRRKFRIRWYNDYEAGKSCQLQEKWKDNSLGGKNIALFPAPQHKEELYCDLHRALEKCGLGLESLREIRISGRGNALYNLFPMVEISYSRRYFVSKLLGCRVTIDQGLAAKAIDGRLKARLTEKAFQDVIVEVKFDWTQNHVLKSYLNQITCRPDKFSKYATSIDAFCGVSV